MKTMTADPVLLNAIKRICEPTEIIDGDGNRIATIFPQMTVSADDLLAFAKKTFDLDKTRQILSEQQGRGITTPELLEHLRSLASAP